MSDKANCYFNGFVNKQNFWYWSNVNPRHLHKLPLCSEKVVWYAVSLTGVIGPYFFNDANGQAVTSIHKVTWKC